MDSQRITAQLGCGALILVIIAAYIGATAGTERMRAPAEGAAQPLPPIFREGNLLTITSMQSDGVNSSPVLRVIDVEGTWVRLRVDPDESATRIAGFDQATDEEKAGIMEGLRALPEQGDWWINTAVSEFVWSQHTRRADTAAP